ncbi:MAG: hypothetical protein ACFNLG_07730 [Prevotella nigrescens]|uniref:hypothetical protein n=1 Tax=Prevotella nigrescens TaxID=28133 RepID=UPI00361EE2BB
MDRKERCIISDSDIPAGSGGINGEGGTLTDNCDISQLLQRYYNASPTLLPAKWQKNVTKGTDKKGLQCIR